MMMQHVQHKVKSCVASGISEATVILNVLIGCSICYLLESNSSVLTRKKFTVVIAQWKMNTSLSALRKKTGILNWSLYGLLQATTTRGHSFFCDSICFRFCQIGAIVQNYYKFMFGH